MLWEWCGSDRCIGLWRFVQLSLEGGINGKLFGLWGRGEGIVGALAKIGWDLAKSY